MCIDGYFVMREVCTKTYLHFIVDSNLFLLVLFAFGNSLKKKNKTFISEGYTFFSKESEFENLHWDISNSLVSLLAILMVFP